MSVQEAVLCVGACRIGQLDVGQACRTGGETDVHQGITA